MAKTDGVCAEKGKRKGKALARQTLEQKKYHILLTNLPQESFDGQQVYELYSLRWQIELLLKAWKSVFDLEKVKEMKKNVSNAIYTGR
ncbi:transposase [Geobacillus proteiniphilus]|uniref:Transposase n=1 Tax=Geobacillus proteiniphilus TaxID=860353 RepID=A0ABY9MIE5_9BACL|nr:transposase [Geobacillus proteiniphilus]WMJ17782.1 transposase [Geobacillus proteiniphilus]